MLFLLQIIEKKLRKSKNSENKDKLQFLLKRMVSDRTRPHHLLDTLHKSGSDAEWLCLPPSLPPQDNQERARQRQEQQRERELQFKREQRERANQGERPYFLKNCKDGFTLLFSSRSCVTPSLCWILSPVGMN